MNFINNTPFKTLPFESYSAAAMPFFTIAIKGSFETLDNQSIALLKEQEDAIVADLYYGEPNTSSLKTPNDLAPYKLNTDVFITGKAQSADGKPLKTWDVNVAVGELKTSLEIHGKRNWLFDEVTGWTLSDAAKCSEVELRYELASGGSWEGKSQDGHDPCNPLGRGLCKLDLLDKKSIYPAPQIVTKGEKIPQLGLSATAAGLGPIPPSWDQRLAYAGTYDEAWEEHQHPLPPTDFQYEFYNAAHPNLIYNGYLKGGEGVLLTGLSASGDISFGIPTFELKALFTDAEGDQFTGTGNLDTLHIDLDKMRVYLVWRIVVYYKEIDIPIKDITLSMEEL